MKENDRFSVPDEVVARDMGGEAVLLDLVGGNYFALDSIGTKLWSRLEDKGMTLAEACDLVTSEYDVGPDEAMNDLRLLFKDLLTSGLIVFIRP